MTRPPQAADGTRHVTGAFGLRMLDESDWEPVDDQLAVGAELDEYDPATGHAYEAGVTYSEEDDDIGPFDVDA